MQGLHVPRKSNQFLGTFYLSKAFVTDFGFERKVLLFGDFAHAFNPLIIVHDHAIQEKFLPATPAIHILIEAISANLVLAIHLHFEFIDLVEFVIATGNQLGAIQLIHVGIRAHGGFSILQEKA